MSDKADFRTRNTARDKKGQFIIMKALFYQKDITTLSVHARTNRVTKYIKEKMTELKKEWANPQP